MNEETKKILLENIDALIKDGQFKDKKIYICSASENSEFVASYLDSLEYKIECIVDENEEFLGCSLHGLPIKNFGEAFIPYKKNVIILLTTPVNNFMGLHELYKFDFMELYEGVKRFSIFYSNLHSKGKKKFKKNQKKLKFLRNSFFYCFIKQFWKMRKAEKKLNTIKKENNKIFLFPHKSLGDIVFISKFLRIYGKEDFILIVIGNACATIAKENGLQNIIFVTQSQMNDFIKCKDFMGNDLDGVNILHYQYSANLYKIQLGTYTPFQEINYRIINNCDIHIIECYDALFSYLFKIQKKEFDIINNNTKIDISKIQLQKKKILFSPYAKSLLFKLNLVYWEKLATYFKEKGYEVFTNVNGVNEIPIYGTKPLSISLENVKDIDVSFDCFIGTRSGFCDVISETNIPKIVLYPYKEDQDKNNEFYMCTFNNIPWGKNISELKIKVTDAKSAVNATVKEFEKICKVG